MMRTLGTILSVPVLVLLGCAGDEPPSDDATNGWRATQLAIGDDEAQWQQQVDVDGKLDVSLECPDGGSYRAAGAYTDGTKFDLVLEFDGCSADGVVIDGDLSLHAEVEVGEDSARVATSYEGSLTWSGEANGSCDVDMTALVAVESSEVDVEVHGEICGYEADAVVHAG
jgi:hypothetical protein